MLVCCMDGPQGSTNAIQDFNAYPFNVLSASATSDGGYLVNNGDGVAKLDEDGHVLWEYRDGLKFVSQSFETLDHEILILNTQKHPKIDTLLNNQFVEDKDTLEVRTQLLKLNQQGMLLWKKSFHITNLSAESSNNLYFRQIINFNLRYNNYGLGTQAKNGDLFVAFSYDGISEKPTFYNIMRFTSNGELIDQERFPMKNSFSRIYAFTCINDRLILSKGGPAWCQFDSYTYDLGLVEAGRYDTVAVPTFTSILGLNNGAIAFTGHADKQDNDVTFSNYEYGFAIGQGVANTQFQLHGDFDTRDLCFNSTLDQAGNILMMWTRRDGDQLLQNRGSDLIIVMYTAEGTLINERIISTDHSLEGYYIHSPTLNNVVIIGTKNGFDGVQAEDHAFFMKVKLN